MAPFSRGGRPALPWPRCHRMEQPPIDGADRMNWSDDEDDERRERDEGGGGAEDVARDNLEARFWNGDFCVLRAGHIIDVNVGGQWCLAVVTKVLQPFRICVLIRDSESMEWIGDPRCIAAAGRMTKN